jgi:CHAD domain-containing protein
VTQAPSNYALPDGLAPRALHDRLTERLELEADASTVLERAYLDTFDGRVRAEDLTLLVEGDRLVVRDEAERELCSLERPGTGPVLAADLPPGRMRDLLEPVLEIRAATLLARVRVRRLPLRVLDAERKTVVRLVVEEPTLKVEGRADVRLAARVAVVGVRGYDKALAKVRRVVEDELGPGSDTPSLVDEAVARAGGRPGSLSSKPGLELDPRQRADTAAVAILAHLQAVIEMNLPGTLDDVDTEFLHDLRVAVRRTRSLQRELKGVFPPDELAHFRAEFKWLQAVTGPTRDLDVYLLDFDAFARSLDGPQQPDLEPLRALLVERRTRERRKMVRALRSHRSQALFAAWQRFIGLLAGLAEDDRPDAARPVAQVAAKRISKVYRQMVRMGEAIDGESPAEALHELRKKGKELRYLLEFFSSMFEAKTVKPMVKTLKSLQDTLGTFQDREVQAEMLRALGEEVAERENGAAALMAMGVLVQRLEAEQAQARGEFAERFAPFAAKGRRASVKETFG